jgi:Flp pilus assembly protein TadG
MGRGSASVEFALVVPLLITIALGCVDFGRFAHAYIAATNAARAGAAFGSCHTFTSTSRTIWEEGIQSAVNTEMAPTLEPEEVQITVLDEGGHRRVEVDVRVRFVTVIAWPTLPDQVLLRRAVQMPFIR